MTFELKIIIGSNLNLFFSDKPGHVLSLSGQLYPLRVHDTYHPQKHG